MGFSVELLGALGFALGPLGSPRGTLPLLLAWPCSFSLLHTNPSGKIEEA